MIWFPGFLSKAKKKLLNEDEPDNVVQRDFNGSGLEYEPNNPWNWDPPPLGKYFIIYFYCCAHNYSYNDNKGCC